MDYPQWYTTAIADRRGIEATIIVLPSRSLEVSVADEHPLQLTKRLGLKVTYKINDRQSLESTLSGILSNVWTGPSEHLEEFAKTLLTSKIIPIERSPLSADSLNALSELGSKPSVIATGIYVGLTGFGLHPIILVAAPVGIILVTASVAAGKALGEGLEYRIRKLMGVPLPRGRRTRRKRKS